jgi:hypothetical protein
LDSRLYLPQCWFGPAYAERRRRCRIPAEVVFHTKPELALGRLQALLATQQFGGRWITCDCSFGNNEAFLEQLPNDCYYLGEIACTRKVWPKACAAQRRLEQAGCTVEHWLQIKGQLNWQTHRIAEGEKGPLVAAFARLRVYLRPDRTPESERWLVLRNDANCKLTYALSNAPQETPMGELVRVSGARWPIERCFQENKLNDACGSLLTLGMSSSLTPRPPRCWQPQRLPRGCLLPLARGGMLSRQLPTQPLPVAPVPVELLQTELQVHLMGFILNSYLNNLVSHFEIVFLQPALEHELNDLGGAPLQVVRQDGHLNRPSLAIGRLHHNLPQLGV